MSNSLNSSSNIAYIRTYEDDFVNFWDSKRDLNHEIENRNQIIKSICPDIFEKNEIKLALILCLIGGIPTNQNGTRIRGLCHLLLVGEPGINNKN